MSTQLELGLGSNPERGVMEVDKIFIKDVEGEDKWGKEGQIGQVVDRCRGESSWWEVKMRE